MIDVGDRLDIHELLAWYGHVIDDRLWSRLAEVLTDDVVFDATDFGLPRTTSLAELRAQWEAPDAPHPLAHHATNIVVREEPDGTVRVRSKGVGVGPGGRVGSVVYDDVVVRTDAGWRLARRTVTLRRPENVPPPT